VRYHILHGRRHQLVLCHWLNSPANAADVALMVHPSVIVIFEGSQQYTQGFREQLQTQLLSRLCSAPNDCDWTNDELSDITLTDDKVYKHATICFNYTTYNFRRASDTVNPCTHADIMVRAPEDKEHLYWYGRVIGIYHAYVSLRGGAAVPMDFLHVRWFGIDWDYDTPKQLLRIGFHNWDIAPDEAFGFVNPADVIRLVHLIPAFVKEQTLALLPGMSLARRNNGQVRDDWTWDWLFYYIAL
jgi:hypothetical protein